MKVSAKVTWWMLSCFALWQGVRRLGAAAVDMCHVALGVVDGYWEFRLKPWDMAAGALVSSALPP